MKSVVVQGQFYHFILLMIWTWKGYKISQASHCFNSCFLQDRSGLPPPPVDLGSLNYWRLGWNLSSLNRKLKFAYYTTNSLIAWIVCCLGLPGTLAQSQSAVCLPERRMYRVCGWSWNSLAIFYLEPFSWVLFWVGGREKGETVIGGMQLAVTA